MEAACPDPQMAWPGELGLWEVARGDWRLINFFNFSISFNFINYYNGFLNIGISGSHLLKESLYGGCLA